MSVQLAFASYLRRGLTRLIGNEADESGVPQTKTSTITLTLESAGTLIERTFPLRGPGSVTALAEGEVMRVVPAAGSIDHPPNLFPAIELATADLPWRFTAAQATTKGNKETLMPWLVLVVVPDRDGIILTSGVPLTVLHVDDIAELPNLEEAWAWAHVQIVGNDKDLDALLADSPENVWARLLCPRYLEPDTDYIAAVVPSFEAGRLSGLGFSSEIAAVNDLAWSSASSEIDLPVYHHWRFHTAVTSADFEELVRRLTPIPLSNDVGVRAYDVSHPGSDRLPQTAPLLGFEGALVSPTLVVPTWRNPHREAWLAGMGELLNPATSSIKPIAESSFDPLLHDPLVAPPAYGLLAADIDEVPSLTQKPTPDVPRWLAQANLDPRHRAVAGVGGDVVRRNQERLMADAWNQARGIQSVNRTLVQTRLALDVGLRLQSASLALDASSMVQVSAPAHARLRTATDETAYGALGASDVPAGTVSAAFRRQLGGGSVLARGLRAAISTSSNQSADDPRIDVSGRLTNYLSANIAVAIRYADPTVPFGTVFEHSGGDVSSGLPLVEPRDGPIQGGPSPGGTVPGDSADSDPGQSEPGQQQPGQTGSLPTRPGQLDSRAAAAGIDRLLANLGQTKSPASSRLRERLRKTGLLGPAANDVKSSAAEAILAATANRALLFQIDDADQFASDVLISHNTLLDSRPYGSMFGAVDHVLTGSGSISNTVTAFDMAALGIRIAALLDPTDLLAARLRAIIQPASALGSEPVPASITLAPRIDDALYRDVVRIDPELLMPGVGSLPTDSVGLAVVNTAFIEAFLLGANHEFARELLWREYPTNLNGTWLKTFWDHAAASGASAADIEAVAEWSQRALGTHDTAGSNPEQVLVLVVKGELLRRYPGTLISAVPARWDTENGKTTREEDTTAAQLNPTFTGVLGSDVRFVGFEFPDGVDTGVDVSGSDSSDDAMPGWYFVFEQPATEPAFGLDTAASDTSPALKFWKDLTWVDARSSGTAGHVELNALDSTLPYDEVGDNVWLETWADSASAMARITVQRPVRMLVHADQMLDTGSKP